MNPVFVLLVIIAAIILWFLLSIVFEPVGKIVSKIWDNTMDIMNKKENNEESEEINESNER